MRVLAVRNGHEAEDIASGQAILQSEIAHPAKTVMVVVGDTPEITRFADSAGARSDPFPFREAVWVKDTRIIDNTPRSEWFQSHESACAVVLDFDDRPSGWLGPGASLFEIEMAFLKAQQGGTQ